MSERIAAVTEADDQDFEQYLCPTELIDSDHPDIIDFALRTVGDERDPLAKALKIFYAVRDDIRYSPYTMVLTREAFMASATLERGDGFCITKAILLAAVGRAVGLPTRLGYADVRNHLATKRLLEVLGTDLFTYHGYTEFFLDGKWVKATPAFNLSLCEKFHVLPLDFDGHNDSIFHPFDKAGRKHMEYVLDRGIYADVPFDDIKANFLETYPGVYDEYADHAPGGDFEAEAEAEN
jgi:transglutaminase-like putative cysteine protease